jgi:hypothetical protein
MGPPPQNHTGSDETRFRIRKKTRQKCLLLLKVGVTSLSQDIKTVNQVGVAWRIQFHFPWQIDIW